MFSRTSFLMILFISSTMPFFPTAILFILKTVGKNLQMISALFLFRKKIILISFLKQTQALNGSVGAIILIRTITLMCISEVNIATVHATKSGILLQVAVFTLQE